VGFLSCEGERPRSVGETGGGEEAIAGDVQAGGCCASGSVAEKHRVVVSHEEGEGDATLRRRHNLNRGEAWRYSVLAGCVWQRTGEAGEHSHRIAVRENA